MHFNVCHCWLLTSLQARQLVQTNARRVSQRIGISTLDPFVLAQPLEDLAALFLRGFLNMTPIGHQDFCEARIRARYGHVASCCPVGNFRPEARHHFSHKVQDPDSIKRRGIFAANARLVFNISNRSCFPNFHPSTRNIWPATWIT